MPFDVRIIAATNRDLEGAVEEGRFREDLYFRINVVRIALPPLRARGDDVLLLAQHFSSATPRSDRQARRGASRGRGARSCSRTSWPGNVRELQNCIERAVALTRYERITVEDLPEKVRDYKRSHVLVAARRSVRAGAARGGRAPLHPARHARRSAATRRSAAQVLGLDRKTLYRKLERYQALGDEAPKGDGDGDVKRSAF